jgi:hypothetical protein
MRDFGHALLQNIAAERSTLSYDQFWSAVQQGVGRDIGRPWRQIPQLLRHVGEQSFDHTGLLLTALVVTEDSDPSPSEGFFRLAARLGMISDRAAPETGVEWSGMTEPQRHFWIDQKSLLYEYFS